MYTYTYKWTRVHLHFRTHTHTHTCRRQSPLHGVARPASVLRMRGGGGVQEVQSSDTSRTTGVLSMCRHSPFQRVARAAVMRIRESPGDSVPRHFEEQQQLCCVLAPGGGSAPQRRRPYDNERESRRFRPGALRGTPAVVMQLNVGISAEAPQAEWFSVWVCFGLGWCGWTLGPCLLASLWDSFFLASQWGLFECNLTAPPIP